MPEKNAQGIVDLPSPIRLPGNTPKTLRPGSPYAPPYLTTPPSTHVCLARRLARPASAAATRCSRGPGSQRAEDLRHQQRPAEHGARPLRQRGRDCAVVRQPAHCWQAKCRPARHLQCRTGLRRTPGWHRPGRCARRARRLCAVPDRVRQCCATGRDQRGGRWPGRNHREHGGLHHRAYPYRNQTGPVTARNAAVGQRGHSPGDERSPPGLDRRCGEIHPGAVQQPS